MKSLCVFCGSATGTTPKYVEMARKFGEWLAKNDITLVYGGATIGVMGAVADGVLNGGGKVIGVIPKSLVDYEIAHPGLTELHVVEGMHERKALMYKLSDAFVSLPGGMGTLDEMFEILTWAQLKYHNKPCYLFNFDGFFDSLLSYLHHAHNEGFIKAEHMKLLKEIKDIESLVNEMKN
jgi:uncharacterized protein (TIGR00730 family)